jgi:hypothetical protein
VVIEVKNPTAIITTVDELPSKSGMYIDLAFVI